MAGRNSDSGFLSSEEVSNPDRTLATEAVLLVCSSIVSTTAEASALSIFADCRRVDGAHVFIILLPRSSPSAERQHVEQSIHTLSCTIVQVLESHCTACPSMQTLRQPK